MDGEELRGALFDLVHSQAVEKAKATGSDPANEKIRFFAQRRTDLLLPFLADVREERGSEEEISDEELRAANARQMRSANAKFKEMMAARMDAESPAQREKTLRGLAALEELDEAMADPRFLDGDEEAMASVTRRMAEQAGEHW